MEKVAVGLSGGVDSAVAALLLKKAGYELIGFTLRTWRAEKGEESRCCDIDDARAVAARLGIPYYPVNCVSDFRQRVVEPFTESYLSGLTPNPCVVCNGSVKWEKLIYYAKAAGAGHIATGHYASVVRTDNGRYALKTARYSQKDQTYMLYRLTQEQLAASIFPLASLTKDEVRDIALEAGLPNARKPDSQEVCFVTDGNYADYIARNSPERLRGEGFFVSESGEILGRHRGVERYTVGQRRGLGVALGYPAYVAGIRPEKNEVVIGGVRSLYSNGLLCGDLNFMSVPGIEKNERLECVAKIRYAHAGQRAVLEKAGDGMLRVSFEEPVRAAAPGQSAVFYDSEGLVIGGGVIAAALR